MATPENRVVVRRTISQILVPYKEVEERFRLKRNSKTSLFSGSINNVTTTSSDLSRKTTGSGYLERSRSEVCLRHRKTSYTQQQQRQTHSNNTNYELKRGTRPHSFIEKPQLTEHKRPQSDFYPETTKFASKIEEKLNSSIETLRREMISLREQDKQLFHQLSSLNEHINDLKKISQKQGGLFGTSEDDEGLTCTSCEEDTPLNGQSNQSRDIKKAKLEPKVLVGHGEATDTNTSGLLRKRVENSAIPGLQETSFEYIEVPPRVTAAQLIAPPPSPKKAAVRLVRRSSSCQVLNNTDNPKLKRYSYVEPRARHPALVPEKLARSARSLNAKQKSSSMSQLRRATKTTETSASDSECSTSGCYGGSSTGSDLDLERSVTYSREMLQGGNKSRMERKIPHSRVRLNKIQIVAV